MADRTIAPYTQVQDAALLKPYELMREKYKQQKRRIGGREKETLARLSAFQSALRAAPPAVPKPAPAPKPAAGGAAGAAGDEGGGYNGRVDGGADHRAYMPAAWRVDDYLRDSDSDDGGGAAGGGALARLRGHALKFDAGAARPGDAMARTEDVGDYVVFDPLLEKAKEGIKFSRREQGARKRQTEWAGGGRG
jgi:peptidyl-prolyl cis-trans isomerase SDCCAG10